jgi:hypothetical protein
MDWVSAILIIVSMVYSGGIVVEYVNFKFQMVPRIKLVDSKAVKWANAAVLETELRDRVKQNIDSNRTYISDLQLAVDEAKLRRQAALLQKKRLDMLLLKTSIRSRRSPEKKQA